MDVIFGITLLLFTSSALANPVPENENFGFGDDGAMNNTIEDPHVGYMVLVDYLQDFLIIKNTTTQTCFYSPLDRYDFLKDEKLSWDKIARQNDFPVTATEDIAKNVFLSWEDTSIRLEKLPGSFKVAEQCFGRPSYRMIQDGSNRDRRSPQSESCGCCCCGCCCSKSRSSASLSRSLSQT